MGCCQPVLGPIENYYTKWQTDDKIEEAISGISAVTIDEVQEMIDESISGISGVTEEEMNNAIASAKTEIEAEIPIVPTKISAFENDVPYLTEHQSLSGYATEQWVEDKHYITGVDLSDYSTTEQMNNAITAATDGLATTAYVNTQISAETGDFIDGEELSSYTYDKNTIDEKIASGGTFDPALYYKKSETSGSTEISNALNLKADKTDVIALSGEVQSKAYTSYVNQRLSGKVDNIISTGEMVDVLLTGSSSLDNWPLIVGYDYVLIPDNIYIVYGWGTSGVYDFSSVDGGYLRINGNYTTSGDEEEYESIDGKFRLPVADIDTTKVNRIYTNPDGITVTLVKEGNDINATEEIKKISGKQDTLSAGTNITIIDNVISAEGGGKAIEAGRGISVTTGATADTVSFNLPIASGSGRNSLVFNDSNNAFGVNAFAEGFHTNAQFDYSHAEGFFTTASGEGSHTEGQQTRALNRAEHASGYYNVSNKESDNFGDSGNTLFSIGNGTENNARHNAFEVRQNGDIYLNDGSKLQDGLVTTTEKTTWNSKANVWCGSEADWALISGGTLDSNTIYLVY